MFKFPLVIAVEKLAVCPHDSTTEIILSGIGKITTGLTIVSIQPNALVPTNVAVKVPDP